MRPPPSGPSTCSTLSASISASSESTRATPSTGKERVHEHVRAGQRRGVRHDHLLGDLGAAGLDGDDGLAQLARHVHRLLEGRRVGQRLQVQADGRDPLLPGEQLDGLVQVELETVAERDHVGDRQATTLHGEVEADVGRGGDDGHASLHALAALLVRPEHGPAHVVQQAVAVRPDEDHVAARLQQLLREFGALLTGLREAGGVRDGAAGVQRRQSPHDIDGEVAVDADVGRIRAPRQLVDRAVDPAPHDLVLLGVDGPDLAVVAHQVALADHLLSLRPAEDCDGARVQQAREARRVDPHRTHGDLRGLCCAAAGVRAGGRRRPESPGR